MADASGDEDSLGMMLSSSFFSCRSSLCAISADEGMFAMARTSRFFLMLGR